MIPWKTGPGPGVAARSVRERAGPAGLVDRCYARLVYARTCLHVLLGALVVLTGLGPSLPAHAQGVPRAGAGDGSAWSLRSAQVGYQRDRLSVQPVGPRWYVVVDGYGRTLSARQLAQALGDVRTFDLALRSARQQQAVGGVATTGGPLIMLVGLNRIAVSDLRSNDFMRAAGYGTLVLGMAGTAGGVALLADRRPRQPPTYYTQEQAERLVTAYNAKLLDTYGLSPEDVRWLPRPSRRVRARAVVGVGIVGVEGSF